MVHLSSLFSSGYVFRRNRQICFFGKADAKPSFLLLNRDSGKDIEPCGCEFKDGAFKVCFPPQEGNNDEYVLLALGPNSRQEFGPYSCGELFLFVGQSNLSISTELMENEEEIEEKAKDANCFILNLFDQDVGEEGFINRPLHPLEETNPKAKWERFSPNVTKTSSALASMIGELLSKSLPCPIGIISTSVGGISIDAFLPFEAVEGDPKIKGYLLKTGRYPDVKFWNKRGMLNYTQTSGFFNEKIAPLKGISFSGVVYYQGENSCWDYESGLYFKRALEVLIDSYRVYFEDPVLPFFVGGIADEYYPYGDRFGLFYIQEALASLDKENVTYVPVFDIDPRWMRKDGRQWYHPIHPINKKPLAERFAYVILENAFKGKHFHYPRIGNAIKAGGSLLLELDLYEDSLRIGDSYFGFTLAGEEGDFFLCEAHSVSLNTIKLTSPYVKDPARFTFAFTHYSYLCSCLSAKGYPLSPCRNFASPVDPSSFDLDFIASSGRYLSLRENNFGPSLGGGMETPIFECGRFVRNHSGVLRKGKSDDVEVEFSLDNDSYYRASVAFNLGLAGLFHRLGSHNRLSLELKADKPISFLGCLFRVNGGIYRFPTLNQEVEKQYETFVVSLDKIEDGSEGNATISKEAISSLDRIEFEFHSEKEEMVTLSLRNIRVYQAEKEGAVQKASKKAVDASLQLPGGNRE